MYQSVWFSVQLTISKLQIITASSDQRQTLMTDSPWRSQNNPPFTQLGSQAVSSSSRLVLDLLTKIHAQWGKSWVCNIDLLLLFLLIESCFFSSSNFTEISRVTPEKNKNNYNLSCPGWFKGRYSHKHHKQRMFLKPAIVADVQGSGCLFFLIGTHEATSGKCLTDHFFCQRMSKVRISLS